MQMKYDKAERLERAKALRKEGYNCSQCVAMSFDDVAGLSAGQLARVTGGFGSGFGGQGEICGAVTGMTVVNGLVRDVARPALYGEVRQLFGAFGGLNGSCVCRELKQPGRKPCLDLIVDAVGILHDHLASAED